MKKNFKTVLLLLLGVDLLVLGLAVFLLARGRGALAPAASSEKPDSPEETFSTIVIPGQDGEANQAALLLSQMSLEEKVGQLFIIRPDSLVPAQTQEQINEASAAGITCLTEAMADSLRKYSVGGVIFFGKNITDPQQITDFIAALQENSATPLFIAVDEEGGAVSRLASHPNFDLPKYESAATVGASGDPAQALEMGAEGVIVPHVRTVEEMKLCVKAAKFPPMGRRGFDTTVRAAQFGMGLDAQEFVQTANATELVIPMCEDFEFTDSLEDVMAVEGIDAINFGPADYSMSTNRPSGYDMKNSNTDEILGKLVEAARPKGIGIMAPALPPTEETIKTLIAKGVNMLICGSDIYHFQNALKTVKAAGVDEYLSLD